MKKTAASAIQMVEYRIFSLPRALAAEALPRWHEKITAANGVSVAAASITLLDLQTWWNGGGHRVTRAGRFRDFSRQRFGNRESIVYEAIPHPENTVTEPEGGELLKIALDESAITTVREYLGDDSESPNSWRLESLSAYVPPQSRFGILISVFSPQSPDSLMQENLDHLSNRTAQRIDRFWPIIYSALCNAETKIFGTSRESGSGLWTKDEPAFGLPKKLAKRSELEPTEEYDFYNILFVHGDLKWARSCEPFNNDSMEGFRKYAITTKNGDDNEEIHLSRAVTLWRSPALTGTQDAVDRVLRISLSSRLMKNLTYNYRLLACALKANYLENVDLTSRELRSIVFQYDIAHQALTERRQYLSKTEYDIVQLHLELSGFDEYVNNCSYLSERVLMAADGVDADKQQAFEKTIQISAFLFAVIALAAVFMDGYNFLAGQPDNISELPPARSGFILLVVTVLTGILILIVLANPIRKKVMRWLRRSR